MVKEFRVTVRTRVHDPTGRMLVEGVETYTSFDLQRTVRLCADVNARRYHNVELVDIQEVYNEKQNAAPRKGYRTP